MSATASIRSGELLARPAALRRAAAVVSFRTWGPAKRVRAVAAEGGGKGKKRAASGITKPKPISPELREFVGGAEEFPRTEAIKLVWAHIKGNNLQVNCFALSPLSLSLSASVMR
jgi:chromatin remodeling complex protein RSC6